MPTCILHFGMHKTGSSSIQESLFRNLEDPRFYYLSLGGSNQSGKILTLFNDAQQVGRQHALLARASRDVDMIAERWWDLLDDQFAKAGGRNVIWSGESLEGPALPEPSLARLRSYLQEQGFGIHAVGYVRSPKSSMESAFQQRLKSGISRFNLDELFPDYPLRLAKFDTVFGRDAVSFWKFDPSRFVGGDVVLDFCSRLGIDFDPEKSIRVNEGLSLPAVKFLYTYWKFGPGIGAGYVDVESSRRLVAALSKLPGPKFRLHPGLVRPVFARNRHAIRWMEDRLGDSLAEDMQADKQLSVSCEKDLLRHSEADVRWLAEQVGVPRARVGKGGRYIAQMMHILREQQAAFIPALAQRNQANAASVVEVPASPVLSAEPGEKFASLPAMCYISLRDMVAIAKQKNDLVKAIDDRQADHFIREAFQLLGRDVQAKTTDALSLKGFGVFRQVSVGVADEDTSKVTRIAFNPAVRSG